MGGAEFQLFHSSYSYIISIINRGAPAFFCLNFANTFMAPVPGWMKRTYNKEEDPFSRKFRVCATGGRFKDEIRYFRKMGGFVGDGVRGCSLRTRRRRWRRRRTRRGERQGRSIFGCRWPVWHALEPTPHCQGQGFTCSVDGPNINSAVAVK